MILALCITATAPQADTRLTPWLFDLQKQFTECINTTDTPYATCDDVLGAGFTLRREIGYALDTCLSIDIKGCATAFNDAGFPAARLNIANLPPCTMLGRLEEIDIRYLPENNCIEHIADTIERDNIPTSHNTDISCSIGYVACLEIVGQSKRYWESAVRIRHLDRLAAIPGSADFANDPGTGHRYYSLLERQLRLQIDLAETTCNIQTVMPHRANTRDYEECMGAAYSSLWQQMKPAAD
ncbi:hypothetical protein [Profundibacter sp.]